MSVVKNNQYEDRWSVLSQSSVILCFWVKDLVELHPCYNKFSSGIDQCKQDVHKSATVSRER